MGYLIQNLFGWVDFTIKIKSLIVFVIKDIGALLYPERTPFRSFSGGVLERRHIKRFAPELDLTDALEYIASCRLNPVFGTLLHGLTDQAHLLLLFRFEGLLGCFPSLGAARPRVVFALAFQVS